MQVFFKVNVEENLGTQAGVFLRTVPTFVSTHTFCASRKASFKRHAGEVIASVAQQIGTPEIAAYR